MKKFGALVAVLLLSITLTACSTFNDVQDTTIAADGNRVTIFLQMHNNVPFAPELVPELKTAILTHNAALHASDADAPYVTAVNYDVADLTAENSAMFRIELVLNYLPDQTVTLTREPFRITRTQTIFNPISLLPTDTDFDFILGFTSSRRHSTVNTDLTVTTQDDGTYVYLWHRPDPIVFTDYYPNRPLYYLIVALGAVIVGLVVYGISRYFYCKNQTKKL